MKRRKHKVFSSKKFFEKIELPMKLEDYVGAVISDTPTINRQQKTVSPDNHFSLTSAKKDKISVINPNISPYFTHGVSTTIQQPNSYEDKVRILLDGTLYGPSDRFPRSNLTDNNDIITSFDIASIKNPSLLSGMGLKFNNGNITFSDLGEKSIHDLDKEEGQAKFKEINQKILDEKKNTEIALKEEKEKRQQAESKISELEAKYLSLENDWNILKKWLSPNKAKKYQKNKMPKAKHIYRELVIYENGKLAFNGKPFHLPLLQIGILALLMKTPGEVVTYEDILENCYPAHKRYNVRKSKTLAKYVSALHSSLKVHFNKEVILNEKGVGWMLIV